MNQALKSRTTVIFILSNSILITIKLLIAIMMQPFSVICEAYYTELYPL